VSNGLYADTAPTPIQHPWERVHAWSACAVRACVMAAVVPRVMGNNN